MAVEVIEKYRPEVVINCAALVGVKECESNHALAWKTNVTGALNVAKTCQQRGIRHVFISSAAIFDGQKGRYKESDEPSPIFYYAIVRLDFFTQTALKYRQVFVDHFTSKIPVAEAAADILRIAASGFIGIINIACSSLPNFPKDISLDLTLWKEKFET